MDYENLRQYMAKEEQEQMDALISRAMHRKERKKEVAAGPKGVQYFRCRCVGMAGMEMEDNVTGKELWEEDYFEIGVERLLRDICSFCLKHGLCQCACCGEKGKGNRKADMTDDELPL